MITLPAYINDLATDIFKGTLWTVNVDPDGDTVVCAPKLKAPPINLYGHDNGVRVVLNGLDTDCDINGGEPHGDRERLITAIASRIAKHHAYSPWVGYLPHALQAEILRAKQGADLDFFPKTRTYEPVLGALPPHVVVTLASPPGFVWHLHLSEHGHAYVGRNDGHTLTVTATPGPNTRWQAEWTAPGLPASIVCRAEDDKDELQAVIGKLHIEGMTAHGLRFPDRTRA